MDEKWIDVTDEGKLDTYGYNGYCAVVWDGYRLQGGGTLYAHPHQRWTMNEAGEIRIERRIEVSKPDRIDELEKAIDELKKEVAQIPRYTYQPYTPYVPYQPYSPEPYIVWCGTDGTTGGK